MLDAATACVLHDASASAEELLPRPLVPIRLVVGGAAKRTPYDPTGWLAAVAAATEGVEVVVLDGVGSCDHDEAPAVVNGLVLAMAAQVAGRGALGRAAGGRPWAPTPSDACTVSACFVPALCSLACQRVAP